MSKSKSSPLENLFSESLEKHFYPTKPLFLLGISGGIDSMALLYLMKLTNQDAFVVHINYQLRGKDSDLDQELVEQMSAEFGFDCASFRVEYDPEKDGNLQAWARDQRYSIFRDLKDEIQAEAIVTAHHQDDQVETILQKLFRASAPENWIGMNELEEDVFRPLLTASKEDIRFFVEKYAVPYRDDSSNKESKYARNFIRLIMDEQLQSLFPGWKTNVLKLQEFGKQNSILLEGVYQQLSKKEKHISKEELSKWDERVQLLILRKFIDSETKIQLSGGRISELAQWKNWQVGSAVQVSEKWRIHSDREYLVLKSDSEVDVKTLIDEELKAGIKFDGFKIEKMDMAPNEGSLYMDWDSLSFPLEIRNWKAGDRIIPFGMDGSKKISDLLTDRKISSASKEKSLVLCGSDGTIYAILFPELDGNGSIGNISNLVRSTEKTHYFLAINRL